jgi:hypothetical protein
MSSVLRRAAGQLSNGTCGSYATPVVITGAPAQSRLADGCYRYVLTGTDRVGNAATLSTTVEVDRTPPEPTVNVPPDAGHAVSVTFGATDSGSGVNSATVQLKRATGTFALASNTCSNFTAFVNIGPVGLFSPFTDTTVKNGHCYEYELAVSDAAGNSATSAPATVRVSTAKPKLISITDTNPGSSVGRPQVGDVLTLTLSDGVSSASVPGTVTLTYKRGSTGATTLAIPGIAKAPWNTGDSPASRYSGTAGSAATVTANTHVSGTTMSLTVTAVSDPRGTLAQGGPAPVSGRLAPSITDVFGNTANKAAFASASVFLF